MLTKFESIILKEILITYICHFVCHKIRIYDTMLQHILIVLVIILVFEHKIFIHCYNRRNIFVTGVGKLLLITCDLKKRDVSIIKVDIGDF